VKVTEGSLLGFSLILRLSSKQVFFGAMARVAHAVTKGIEFAMSDSEWANSIGASMYHSPGLPGASGHSGGSPGMWFVLVAPESGRQSDAGLQLDHRTTE
jgi:hypothetical protein